MKLEAIGIRDDTGFKLVNKKAFMGGLLELPPGKYRMTVKKLYKEKSTSQLGYYYGCVLPVFLEAANAQGWEFVNVEELDNYLKTMFANKELINKITGEIITIPALKRNMTTLELSTFTNQVRDYCAEFLGVVIPDPEIQLEIKIL